MRHLTKAIFSSNDQGLDSDLIQPVQLQNSPASLYCGPNGACNLSSLDNGVSGYALQGQAMGDNSGYSVGSAGDINGDGLADILVGAYMASPPGLSHAGKTYVVFGTRQTYSGTLNLTSLTNGQQGFVLQGQAINDTSGISVSSAGDVNGDGLADILIGASTASPPGLPQAGKTYVVFGINQTKAWGSGTVNLTSLMDGHRGFVLQGQAEDDRSGSSVSGAGDINGDGLADILVGAPYAAKYAGETYVVFGSNQANAWGSGTINLASLMNGQKGFVLQGQTTFDYSGYSVSGAGDINGDGLADILIGAPIAFSSGLFGAGKTYVVFGSNQTNVWGSGTVNLTSLMDGKRGFVLQGQEAQEGSGSSVSGAGDINGDRLADILTGAPYANFSGLMEAGKTYVVFGSNQANAWKSGTVNLTSLMDGQQGFVLQGQASEDRSGWSVSGTGDINGDGWTDMLIGAPAALTNMGKTYVVLGGNQTNLWGSGTVNLTSLMNGQRGFMLQGQVGDASGISVSDGGDINGDGVADILVGAWGASSFAGRTYVVFGETPLRLINNSLTIYPGETLPLTSTFLAAISPNQNNSTLIFVATAVSHGQFETMINPGIPLTNFTQNQIWQGDIQFAHDGSTQSPSYNISVVSGIVSTNPLPTNVTFIPLEILKNVLTINQGQTVSLTTNNLYASGGDDASLQFTITNLQHGEFSLNTAQNQTVLSFTQQNILDNQVIFIHDNSLVAPGYTALVTNGKAIAPPSNATIYFDTLPVIVNNQIFLLQGQNLQLNSNNLLAFHNNVQDPNLQFIVTNVQHGHFERITQVGTAITTFLQQEIVSQQIVFVPDGGLLAPNYQLQVTDGMAYSVIVPGTNFLVTQNYLPINQGETLPLNISYLNINSNQLSADQIDWKVNSVQYGQFVLQNNSGYAISSFTQQQIDNLAIAFVPDNSTNAPSCSLVITNNQNQFYGLVNANVDFDTPPWLVKNQLLTTFPGQSQFINLELLSAKDNEINADNLLFLVDDCQNGHFAFYDDQTQMINQFLQQDLNTGAEIMFITNKTGLPPSYRITVNDGRMNCSGCPQAANITFDPVGPRNSDKFSWPQIATAAVVIGGVGLLLAVLRLYIKYKLVPNYFENTQTQGTERERAYRQQVILPIAKHIYDRVKFSSVLGYTSETTVSDYVDAVSELVRQLEALSVDARLGDMPLAAQSRLLETIGIQTQKQLIGRRSGCSLKNVKSIVSADTTPALLRESAAIIAQAVRDDLQSLEIREEGEDEKAESKVQFSSSFLSSLWQRASQTSRPRTALLHAQSNTRNYSTN